MAGFSNSFKWKRKPFQLMPSSSGKGMTTWDPTFLAQAEGLAMPVKSQKPAMDSSPGRGKHCKQLLWGRMAKM